MKKCSRFATTKQHKLSYTWEATRSSMRPLLGLAMASREVGNGVRKNAVVLQQPSNTSFQYLGGHAQLDKAVVGVGNGLEEVGNSVGGNTVVLQQPSEISFLIPGRPRAAR